MPSEPLSVTLIAPARVQRRDDGVYFIDFGRDAFAQLRVEVDPSVESKLSVRLGEKLADANHLDPKPGGSIRFLQTSVSHSVAVLTPDDARRMPRTLGPVMPFRYAELQGLPENLSPELLAKTVRQATVTYLFDDQAADFVCSNEKVNAVWNFCKYSIKATSFAGLFVDGDRERKPYEADAFINGLGWFCCTSDLTLPPLTDRYLIDHPTWPTEWSLFSVLCAWNDYLYTGDLNGLREVYPELKLKCLRSLEREDGLISTENIPPAVTASLHLGREKLKDIVDWPVGERDGCEMKPINTVVNAFHCRALALLAKMAAALGIETEAAEFQSAADRSRASLNQKLFDAATGLYVDGQGSSHSSQHANLFPLAFGLVPAERLDQVLAFVKSRGMACSVYGAQFLMEGLFDHGAGDDAVALMIAPGDRSWRHMVEETGSTLSLEAWDSKYKPNQDWNHAWGAAPANLIPRKILGVEPIDAGFAKCAIRPPVAGPSSAIAWARGKVPTVKGPIAIDWHAAGEAFHLVMTLPTGVAATVDLPPGWGNRVSVDGHPAELLGRGVEVGSGTHTLHVGN